MKKLYFVQAGFSFSKTLVYLPYAAGCLMATAFSDGEIASYFEQNDIIFQRDTIENNLDRIHQPDIVAFSNYFWNVNYNKTLAKKIKEKYPDCLIVFGGHNVVGDSFALQTDDFIDVIIRGEGEIAFKQLLLCYKNGLSFGNIEGIDYRENGCIISTKERAVCDLSELVSPYTFGVFDPLLEKNPDIQFHATIETNRGCPYSCAYCEWSYDKKLRMFALEKVKSEVRWISEHKIPYCFCADGNFGIAKRDIEIAKFIVKTRQKNGYPNIFKPCYAKESNDIVFEAGRILNEAGADKGVTISYQTLCPEALKNIHRDNLDIHQFTELSGRYNAIGIPTYSDLILGLPGETFESFAESLSGLMEAGQNNSVTFHHCQVYHDALMGDPHYRKEFGIEITKVPMDTVHFTPEFSGIEEYQYIITSTYSMNREMWEKANVYGICVEAFHYIGLLRCFAIYLRFERQIPYLVFYNALFEYVTDSAKTEFLYQQFRYVEDMVRHPEKPWAFQKDIFGSTGWYLEEGLFLESVYHFDTFWEEIIPFLKSFEIEEDVFEQLLLYQKGILCLPHKEKVVLNLQYDFYHFFENIYEGRNEPLKKVDNRLTLNSWKIIHSWDEYAREIIWYGKRKSATLMTSFKENVNIDFLK
ncbi:MAG: radical SAM protein [Clostridia bacterium]|nr:radical SAM protein [Clostridia bacterium]